MDVQDGDLLVEGSSGNAENSAHEEDMAPLTACEKLQKIGGDG
jgi:hypothetical protein